MKPEVLDPGPVTGSFKCCRDFILRERFTMIITENIGAHHFAFLKKLLDCVSYG